VKVDVRRWARQASPFHPETSVHGRSKETIDELMLTCYGCRGGGTPIAAATTWSEDEETAGQDTPWELVQETITCTGPHLSAWGTEAVFDQAG
jgi:hypothetical protein